MSNQQGQNHRTTVNGQFLKHPESDVNPTSGICSQSYFPERWSVPDCTESENLSQPPETELEMKLDRAVEQGFLSSELRKTYAERDEHFVRRELRAIELREQMIQRLCGKPETRIDEAELIVLRQERSSSFSVSYLQSIEEREMLVSRLAEKGEIDDSQTASFREIYPTAAVKELRLLTQRAAVRAQAYSRYLDQANAPVPISKLELPQTTDEMAQLLGIESNRLESHISQRIAGMLEEVGATRYPEYDGQLMKEMHMLFHIGDQSPTECPEWVRNFGSFEGMMRAYAPTASSYTHGKIAEFVDRYVEVDIHRSRLFSLDPIHSTESSANRAIFHSEGNWLLTPESFKDTDGQERFYKGYMTLDVLKEAIQLHNKGYVAPDFSHSSGSAALGGIAQQGGLVSAANLLKSGEQIKTGEHFYYIEKRSDIPSAGGKHGLSGVYTMRGGPHHAYCFVRWFNEYPVSFGIDGNRQKAFLEAQNPERCPIKFLDSCEGIVVGERVPLRNISHIFSPAICRAELNEWAKHLGPTVELASYEAAELLGRSKALIEQLALLDAPTDHDLISGLARFYAETQADGAMARLRQSSNLTRGEITFESFSLTSF